MARNHVHLAVGKPGKNGVISGMRASCEVVIELNMVRAIYDGGLDFYISSNKVILSEGLEGTVPSKYFRTVENYKKKEYVF